MTPEQHLQRVDQETKARADILRIKQNGDELKKLKRELEDLVQRVREKEKLIQRLEGWASFDGMYVYYVPPGSDTFVCFDTTQARKTEDNNE